MSSQYTPRLGLMKPQGTDPFLRQDFIDMVNILDGAPGAHVCTSTTRPSWGSAQANRLIFESDLGRLLRWTGTDWADLNQYAHITHHAVAPNQTLGSNAAPTYSLGSFNLPRFAKAVIIGTAAFTQQSKVDQAASAALLVNGAPTGLGFTDAVRIAEPADGNSRSQIPLFGVINLAAGTGIQLSLRVSVGAAAGGIIFNGAKAVVIRAEQG